MYPILFSRQENKRKEQTQNKLYLDITKAVYAMNGPFNMGVLGNGLPFGASTNLPFDGL